MSELIRQGAPTFIAAEVRQQVDVLDAVDGQAAEGFAGLALGGQRLDLAQKKQPRGGRPGGDRLEAEVGESQLAAGSGALRCTALGAGSFAGTTIALGHGCGL